jgi:hypothetical protein
LQKAGACTRPIHKKITGFAKENCAQAPRRHNFASGRQAIPAVMQSISILLVLEVAVKKPSGSPPLQTVAGMLT